MEEYVIEGKYNEEIAVSKRRFYIRLSIDSSVSPQMMNINSMQQVGLQCE